MASSFLDVCRFNPTAGGTTDWTFSSAVVGYQSPAAAGVVNGATYSYRAESNDLTQWEIGTGSYNTATAILSRTTVLFNSSGGTSKINFSTTPQVAIVALGEDLLAFNAPMSLTAAQQDQGKANLGVIGKNVVINAGFTINQRNYASAATLAAGAYGHDRWKAGASGGDYSFSQLAGPTTITIAANKSLIQVVEDKNVLGGTYTLSWSGSATARVTVNSATPSGNFAVSPITVTSQTAGTTMSIEFTGANAAGGSSIASNTGTVGTVQLEQAAKAAPFEFRGFGVEFHNCQRYFQTSFTYGTTPANGGSSTTIATGAGQVGMMAPHPTVGNKPARLFFSVPMRAIPSMASYGNNSGSLGYLTSGVLPTTETAFTFNSLFLGTVPIDNTSYYLNNQVATQTLFCCIGGWTASSEL